MLSGRKDKAVARPRNQRYLHPGRPRAGVSFCAKIENRYEIADEIDVESFWSIGTKRISSIRIRMDRGFAVTRYRRLSLGLQAPNPKLKRMLASYGETEDVDSGVVGSCGASAVTIWSTKLLRMPSASQREAVRLVQIRAQHRAREDASGRSR